MIDSIYTIWVIGGIILLIIIAGTCFLWYQHTTALYEKEAEETVKLLQKWKTEKLQTKDTSETESAQTSVKSITSKVENQTTDKTQDNETITIEKSLPNMSKFGLGPYPEIPTDGPYPPNYLETCQDVETELLRRVNIKMHIEGILDNYSSIGINYETRLVTPIEYGTVLVEYETNQNSEKRIVRVTGLPEDVPPGMIYTHASEIPSHLKIVTPEEVSFDPYEYLGLRN